MAMYKAAVAYNRHFFMVSSTDHLAAKTGLTPAVNISKAGAAFGAAAGAVTEIANGWYRVALTTADTSTTGDLLFHITSAGADDTDFADQIVSYDPFDAAALGLSRIDAAITSRMATFTLPTNFASLVIDANGRVDLSKWIGVAPNALVAGMVSSIPSVLRTSATQAGATSTTIVLDASASATDSFYKDCWVVDTTTGQTRLITAYVGATKTATVGPAWQTTPGTGDTYAVLGIGRVVSDSVTAGVTVTTNNDKTGYALTQAFPANFSSLSVDASGRVDVIKVNGTSQTARDLGAQLDATVSSRLASATVVSQSGTAQAGAASTVTLAAGASATDSIYNGQTVVLLTATGAGQSRVITGYVGATKVATVDRAWQTNPDATTTYAVLALDSAKTDSSLQVVSASVQGNVTGSVASVTGAVGSVTAGVTVTTNNDKTGYSLSQSFPANFALLSVDGSGRVDIAKWVGVAPNALVGGRVDATVGAMQAGVITSAAHAVGAIDAASLATDAGNEIADAILDRDMSTGTDSGSPSVRTVRQSLRVLRNKASIAAGTLTVTKEDDATSSWTAAVTTSAGNPISGVDPA